METNQTEPSFDYYVKKVENHPKMQHFLKVIPLPKYPTLFKLLVMLLFVKLEFMAKSFSIPTFFLPSIVCILFLWYYQMAINAVFIISENCLIEESFMQNDLKNNWQHLAINFPGDPLYITEEDRQCYIDMAVMDYRNYCTSLKWRIKNHKISFCTTVLYYTILFNFLSSFSQ